MISVNAETLKLTREERDRILAGDVTPLVREDEPECKPGDKIILKWSRSSRHVDHRALEEEQRRRGEKHLPAEVVRRHVSVAPPAPLVILTVTAKRRHKKGGWRVIYDFADLRQTPRLPRRVPPTRAQKNDAERPPLTDAEIAKASEESNYTSSPREAADDLDAVDPEYQTVLVTRARQRFVESRDSAQREQRAEELAKNMAEQLRGAVLAEVRAGRDPVVLLAEIQRLVSAQRDETRDAA